MKKSVLNEMRVLQKTLKENGSDYTPHFLVGVDMCEDGTPQSTMMISKSKPFEAIGMIDLLIKNLNDTKKDIIKSLSQKTVRSNKDDNKTIEKLLSKLPVSLKEKVLDIKARMDKALRDQNVDEMIKIKKELEDLRIQDYENDSDDKKDDEGSTFDINDFKG